MNTILQFLIYGLLLAGLTFLIWIWNRGAQHRRFNRAFPKNANAFWAPQHQSLLSAIEDAYALNHNWASRIPPTSTPMDLYLTLYPEHCIYDDCENERFLIALETQFKQKLPSDVLSQTFEQLAARWQEASTSTH